MIDKVQRVTELEALILKYQKSYYDGEAEISDGEFDLLWNELNSLDPENPLIKKIGSGSDALRVNDTSYTEDGFPKAKHIIPMGSQEKAANPPEFLVWAEKISRETEKPELNYPTGNDKPLSTNKKFIVQFKLDGASLELQYEKGSLVRAVTRGDGIVGDEITANARRMDGVIPKLDVEFSGGIRGEVLMSHDIWNKKYTSRANCRNAANGIMRRKDGEGCEDLMLICYDAAANDNDSFFTDELQKINWLSQRGFRTASVKIFDKVSDIIEYRAEISASREKLPFDIDGLVVKNFETDMADLRRARPEKQIAFKFELETAFSILRRVEWSESGATYTPIAVVDPVRIAGTMVQRANLNNPGMIRSLGLKIGSMVSIVKRGEIIPKIEGLAPAGALPMHGPNTGEIEFPRYCTTCTTELIDAGTRLYCPNTACSKRLLHRLEKWVLILNIRELGEKLISQLFSKGRVRRISDLYTLEAAELAEYERMGELSAAKVIRHINTKRDLSLASFIAGFDIEGVAETTVEKIINAGYDTLEKLRAASVEELAKVYGLGTITAATIIDGLRENAEEMDALIALGYISIKYSPSSEPLPLAGLSFCFTGELALMKRSQAEEAVKIRGALVKSTVVKDLSWLVTNDTSSHSAKNKKAHELGIPVINEEQFMALLHQNNRVSDNGVTGKNSAKGEDKPNSTPDGQGLLF